MPAPTTYPSTWAASVPIPTATPTVLTQPVPLPVGDAPALDPLAPFVHLLHTLLDAGTMLAVGIPLGLLAARVMRRWHLHWSWAAIAPAPLLALHIPLRGTALLFSACTLTAAVRGRRWHREDLDAGADLAEIAHARTTPLDALRAGVSIARARLLDFSRNYVRRARLHGPLAGLLAAVERVRSRFAGSRLALPCGQPAILGYGRAGRPVTIELGGSTGGTHTLVVGATGAGKTVTQARLATEAIARRMSAVIIDPKGDRALRDAACRAAATAGASFVEWTPTGPSAYNPCARGSATEIADRVLAAEHYTEPHYQRQAQRYVNHAIRALQLAELPVSLAQLVRMLDPEQLEVLSRELPERQARTLHDYLDSLTPRQRTDISGVRDRLAIIVESDVGRWLEPPTTPPVCDPLAPTASSAYDLLSPAPAAGSPLSPAAPASSDSLTSFIPTACIDLLIALQQRATVYFDLRADSRPLLAQMLAAAIVQDLQAAISSLQHHPTSALIVIDEFSALATEHVARLFGRARSAGVSLLLGTQELSDLRVATHPQLLEQVLGNTSTLLAHRQAVPDSAELVSRLAGTRGAWRTTWSGDDRRTRTRVREPLLDPGVVKRLARGDAAVIRLAGRPGVEIARISAPSTPPLPVSPQG